MPEVFKSPKVYLACVLVGVQFFTGAIVDLGVGAGLIALVAFSG